MVEPAKTFEEFTSRMETSEEFRQHAYKHFIFAEKERVRLREKHKRLRQKQRDAIPPEQRRKVGRPRKNPDPEQPKE